ncbi:MAG: carboxymuconolactone decarboxylase family protein [Candidatus Lokiarchaeota archaeon]|nr:carboxymuconolactone decarboxylase family protein [Candidatus Lokiarchaeota archaeon]
MRKRNNDQKIRKSERIIMKRLDTPRIPPLDEIEYVKELFMFRNAINRLEYAKGENGESEWENEIRLLIQWLKDYKNREINNLTSFLKLDKGGLDIESIVFEDFENSIKSFIKQEGTIFNLKAIMTKYKKLRLKWLIMASQITYGSSLPPRDKEILILRVAWLTKAKYEWDHHLIVGKQAGLTEGEINRIKEGLTAKGWDNNDAILIRAVDELFTNTFISNTTWKSLSEQYDPFQLMDLIFTVGGYNMLAMFLNSFGAQTEDCVKKIIETDS